MSGTASAIRLCALATAGLTLAACSSTSSSESSSGGFGSTLKNLVMFGGTTAPPATTTSTSLEGPDCPPVDIADGGAALRQLSSKSMDASAVTSQISISDVARECTSAAEGGTSVKIGVQGRFLLGPGGTAAKFDAPLRFVLKRGDRILASRVRRVTGSVTAGDPQGSFTVVEEGLVAPPGEFEIEVGLGNGATAGAAAPRSRRTRS